MIQMSLFTKQKLTDLENKLMVTKVERWESESVRLCDAMDCNPWTYPGQNTGVGSVQFSSVQSLSPVRLFTNP